MIDGYVAAYFLYVGQRAAEALKAIDASEDDGSGRLQADRAFATDVVEIAELGRMENTTVFMKLADWKRLLSLIPDVQPRMPVKPGDKTMPKPLQDEIDNITRLKAKIAAATKGNLRTDLKLVEEVKEPSGPAEAS